ncbi:MAG: hypothetical protein ACOX4R_03475 [Lentihominibacter sp.]|jgi:hypothetical protein
MIINLPPLESELFQSWEKHIEEHPELKNSPEFVRKNYERALDDLYTGIIFLASF